MKMLWGAGGGGASGCGGTAFPIFDISPAGVSELPLQTWPWSWWYVQIPFLRQIFVVRGYLGLVFAPALRVQLALGLGGHLGRLL